MTVTRGEGGEGNGGKKEKVKDHVQRTHEQGQWVGDCLWDHWLDKAEDSNGGKNEDYCN